MERKKERKQQDQQVESGPSSKQASKPVTPAGGVPAIVKPLIHPHLFKRNMEAGAMQPTDAEPSPISNIAYLS